MLLYVYAIKGDDFIKTLVIHPSDPSTLFLSIIYSNHLDDWTIINDTNIKKEDLMDLIKKHDKIIMLGHGIPSGLLNPKSFGLIIDDDFASILKQKETISIWCHSDEYFRRHNIPGFHTGMIISEVAEALYVLGFTPLTKEETLNNMVKFSSVVKECIDRTPNEMKEYILANYNDTDPVTLFNRKNIIVL